MCLISGCLWHACFGKEGERTFDYVDMEHHPNLGPALGKNGVLMDIQSLNAVIYTVHKGNDRKFVGFHKTDMEDEGIREALHEICDFVNDEKNTHFHSLPINPMPMNNNQMRK